MEKCNYYFYQWTKLFTLTIGRLHEIYIQLKPIINLSKLLSTCVGDASTHFCAYAKDKPSSDFNVQRTFINDIINTL